MKENDNTPERWDAHWAKNEAWGSWYRPIFERVSALLAEIPKQTVHDYGFGHLGLAELIGKDQWHGHDISAVAVERAKEAGYKADVLSCVDSPGYRRSYLCALHVLPHMEEEEREAFLSKSRNAPHAFFSVRQQSAAPFRTEEEFGEYLRTWWPHVETETFRVGQGDHLFAHGMQRPRPLLTIGCSTLLDFHGVAWTLAAMNTIHGYARDLPIELVVVDNHPDPKTKEDRKAISDMRTIVNGEGARYVRWSEKQGTYPGKNQLKLEAQAPWVLTFDSHVMLSPGTIETVLDLMEREPKSNDFYHFPNIRSGQRGVSAVDFRTQDFIYWRKKPCYGWTGEADKGGDPYPVAAMITSCYLVRKEAWLSAKGYDPILGNYGGWEGPLQTKWWLMGRRVLSMRHVEPGRPTLHHWHLFNNFKRLNNATGRVHTKWSKLRNFMASAAVIGGEKWARRLAERWNVSLSHKMLAEGLREGMKLRPWMIENLARPEWEDITVFFQWMLDEGIPGALTEW